MTGGKAPGNRRATSVAVATGTAAGTRRHRKTG